MSQRDKSKYANKQKQKTEDIEKEYGKKGPSRKTAERRALADAHKWQW